MSDYPKLLPFQRQAIDEAILKANITDKKFAFLTVDYDGEVALHMKEKKWWPERIESLVPVFAHVGLSIGYPFGADEEYDLNDFAPVPGVYSL